jgi:DNA-binding MarR family transcriptional regulator
VDSARFAYSGLERIFHERGRLAVCISLIASEGGMRFAELQEACALTDGNLSRHLHALTEVSVVTLARERHGTRMATVVRITPQGRERFLAYLDELEAVVRDARAHSVESIAPPCTLSPAKAT